MSKYPLVSIVITYFNKKEYIRKTLKSIFSQSYKNYEIILVYDDESLNDLQLIELLLIKFKKKKLLQIKKILVYQNQGIKH